MLELPSWHVAWHSPSLVVAEAYENSDQEGSSELSASVEKTLRSHQGFCPLQKVSRRTSRLRVCVTMVEEPNGSGADRGFPARDAMQCGTSCTPGV